MLLAAWGEMTALRSTPARAVGRGLLAAAALWLTGAGFAAAQSCTETATYRAERIAGEVAGHRAFAVTVHGDWLFRLAPADHGWVISVIDSEGLDRAAITPPLRMETNPRNLFGWHFRNPDNSGPNLGEVNAPQYERRFQFSTPQDEAVGAGGTGWLEIRDMGLADLEPGQHARMVYLAFEACVYHPKSPEQIAMDADLASPVFLPEEVEIMRACGLGDAFELDARVLPRMLGGDFDGDGALDHAAWVRRASDGRYGVAVCRAGTWMDLLGVGETVPGSPMEPNYFDMVEAWAVSSMDNVPGGWEGEGPRPETRGDVLVLERIEKALYSVYWDGAAFRSHQHYRYVEP